MSVVQIRGGVPHVVRDTIDTTGRMVHFPFYLFHLQIRNKGANVVRMYFTQLDYTNDVNYVEVPVASPTYPYGEFEGPVETTAGDHEDIWLKSITGSSAIELVGYQRRG